MSDSEVTWAPERLLAELERLALRASIRAEFFDEAAARLKRVVAFDGACWQTHDPGSDLITQHRLQDIEDHFPVVAHNEYAVDDVNKFARLARAERKAATISQATGGHPERSPRFRDLLNPGGYGPELRSVFVADGSSWGSVILVRRAGQPEFQDRDVELVADASALFARAVRRGLVAEACESAEPLPDAPAVIELDPSGELMSASSSAAPLLAELSGSTPEAGARSPSIHALASATRTAIAAGGQAPHQTLPSATVKTPAGTWLVLHGGLLGDTRSGSVAVYPAGASNAGCPAVAEGLRPYAARAGGHPAHASRRNHDPGGAATRDLPGHSPTTKSIFDKPARAPAASCPRRCSSASISRASSISSRSATMHRSSTPRAHDTQARRNVEPRPTDGRSPTDRSIDR